MSTAARDNGTAGRPGAGGGAEDREIAAAGHADLSADTLTLVEAAFREGLEQLERLEGPVGRGRSAVVRCGAGAPPAWGRGGGWWGRPPAAVVPPPNGGPPNP
ncbi:hypothetical protein ACFWUX_23110, partial [Streptomyces sp. NPDC058625]